MDPRALHVPDQCHPVALHALALSFLLDSIILRFSPARLDTGMVL